MKVARRRRRRGGARRGTEGHGGTKTVVWKSKNCEAAVKKKFKKKLFFRRSPGTGTVGGSGLDNICDSEEEGRGETSGKSI